MLLTPVGMGRIIKTKRTDLGMSQAELARRVGISRNNLGAIEQGRTPGVSWFSVSRILEELGITMEVSDGAKNRVPLTLIDYAKQARLNPAEIDALAAVCWAGQQPGTVQGWAVLHNILRILIEQER